MPALGNVSSSSLPTARSKVGVGDGARGARNRALWSIGAEKRPYAPSRIIAYALASARGISASVETRTGNHW